MTTTFHHTDAGTEESVWHAYAESVPVLHFADLSAFRRIVVVAPHPDDESLGAGGLVASLSASGARVSIVVCSDGEGADGPASSAAVRALGVRRRHEVATAVRALTTGADVELHLLGLPDGRLDDEGTPLRARLAPLLVGAEVVVAPWPGDGHPDHRAVGLAVRDLVDPRTPRLEYPVWAWHWGTPADFADVEMVKVPLSPSARRAKAEAITRHASQLTGLDPILTAEVRQHFDRDHELFVVDARTRASLPQVPRSSSEFFDQLHRSAPGGDPWDFDRSAAEQRRFDLVVDCLGSARFRTGIELGCSTGQLTRRLAARVDHLLAVDTSARAIEVAMRQLDDLTNVELRAGHAPDDLLDDDDGFDLVVLSEIGYYFTESRLAELVAELRRRTAPGATLLASHWTGTSADHELDAATTHRIIDEHLGWDRTLSTSGDGHLVDVWTST